MSDWADDRIKLTDVMARYAAGVDNRDMVMYRSCFADDVVVTGFGENTITGGDAWTDYVIEALKAFGPTQHMLGHMLSTIDGDNAECRTDVQAHHYMADDPKKTLTLWATYEQTMARIDGEWKIKTHHLTSRGTRIQSDQE